MRSGPFCACMPSVLKSGEQSQAPLALKRFVMPSAFTLTPMLLSEARPVPAGWVLQAYFQAWGEEHGCPTQWPQPELHVFKLEVDGLRALLVQKGPAGIESHVNMRPTEYEWKQCIEQAFADQKRFLPAGSGPMPVDVSGKTAWLWLEAGERQTRPDPSGDSDLPLGEPIADRAADHVTLSKLIA